MQAPANLQAELGASSSSPLTSAAATAPNHHQKNGGDPQPKHRICRDFLRGQCRRMYCKYPHVQSPDSVVFCHDYQNSSCPRINCKFLHYSITEEEFYRNYGEFPQPEDFTPAPPTQPPADYYSTQLHEMAAGRPPHVIAEDHSFSPCRHACYKRPSGDLYDGKIKRSRDDEILAVLRRFEDDQSMLRRRVEVNEMKIAELRAANDYLLTQNAQLRLTTVQCSRIVNPVTVTQTVTSTGQSLQPQVINTVSMAPIQALQVDAPIVTVATPQNLLENISTLSTSTQLTGQLAGQQISQIHVGPAISAPSMGLTINTINTSQAISNATQPIISYPIMTHSTLASILPH